MRYGGEEFTLLLPDTDARGAELLVQEVQQLLRRQLLEHVGSPLGRVSFSAGIAVGDLAREGVTAERLMAAADAALYQAKRQGRDGYCLAESSVVGVNE
ncbi:Phytochrome-like protein cph2 [compost metagenome]